MCLLPKLSMCLGWKTLFWKTFKNPKSQLQESESKLCHQCMFAVTQSWTFKAIFVDLTTGTAFYWRAPQNCRRRGTWCPPWELQTSVVNGNDHIFSLLAMRQMYSWWSHHFALIWRCLDGLPLPNTALWSYLVVHGGCIIADHSTLLLFGGVFSAGEAFGVKWHQLECLFRIRLHVRIFTVFWHVDFATMFTLPCFWLKAARGVQRTLKGKWTSQTSSSLDTSFCVW